MDTRDALDLANEHNLQLVEVNPKANPPVCKVMDYGKFKYETAKREREAKKHQVISELKEIKFRPKTHGHDFDFKVRHCRRFLGDGDKVKLVVQFRGREVTHPETGRHVLDRVVETCADIAQVIQMPSMEGNRMNMVLAPRKDAQQQAPKRAKAPAAPGSDKGSDKGPKDAPKPAAPAAAAPNEAQDGGSPPPAADGGDKPAAAAPAAPAATAGDDAPSTAESSA